MPKRVSNRLSRLIRERSYLSGEIVRAHDRIIDLTKAMGELRTQLFEVKADLEKREARKAELDRLIRQGSSAIDPTEINTVKKTPRTTYRPRGELVGAVIENLRASPDGISTVEMTDRIAPQFGMPWGTPKERDQALERVRRILNQLKEKGAAERFRSAITPHGQRVGIWRWVER